jgi:hypothetical protein
MGRLVRVWGDGRVEWAAGDDELLHVGAENGAGLLLRGGFPEGQAP